MRQATGCFFSKEGLLLGGAVNSRRSEVNMQTTAAVAWEARRPLGIEPIELAGPGAGEVRVRVHATGVGHTHAYARSGADPEGMFVVTHTRPRGEIKRAVVRVS